MLKLESLIKDKLKIKKIKKLKKEGGAIQHLTKFDLVEKSWNDGIQTIDGIYKVLADAESKGLLIRKSRPGDARDNHTRLRDQARWYLSQLAKRGSIDRKTDFTCRPYDIDVPKLSSEINKEIGDDLDRELDTLDEFLIDND